MGLHVRTITPYALPGVLALLACWWFFSRKKDRRSTKHDHISTCVGKVETDNALEDLLKEDIQSSSRAQPVQLDKEDEVALQENSTCSIKEPSLYPIQSYCKVENNLLKESPLQTVEVGILQGFAKQKVVESKSHDSFGANKTAEVQAEVEFCTDSVLSQSLDGNKAVGQNSDTVLNDAEKLCAVSTESPCGCSRADDHEFPLKVIDQQSRVIHDGELLEICSQHEAFDIPEKNNLPLKDVDEIKAVTTSSLTQVEGLVSREIELRISEPSRYIVPVCQNEIQEISCGMLNQQSHEVLDYGSAKPCSCSENVAITQSDKISAISAKELGLQPSASEMQVGNVGNYEVQCCQSAEYKIGLACNRDVKLSETQSSGILPEQVTQGQPLDLTTQSPLPEAKNILQGVESVTESEPTESCVKFTIMEEDREDKCTNLVDAFSKCVEKNEGFENSCPIVDGLKDTKTFFEDYEAKIVEQLAINLISKVIVAARQEILSSSNSEVSDSSCQVLEENRDVLDRNVQSKQLVPESGQDSLSERMDFNCTCESTQFEPLQNKDLRSKKMASNEFCLEHQSEGNHSESNASLYPMTSVSDFSPVHRTDFFEESQPALEDSSLSVCTSEEGLNIDDPMQSTVLSTLSIGYDSLGSSGIELSREAFNVSMGKPKKAMCGEKELYSNGDIKRGSPHLNNGGPLTAESEVDHSGGSDVNSMDSVDSGCALGSSEQFQNVKEKSDAKKAELVIWEFEVPKYLVGRLIGKQGRFVSFLKQSSGAKIYISTVPYTQDIQICHLEGSQQQIDRALSLIRKKFKDLNLTNIFAPPPPLIPLPVASWLTLPDNVSVEVVVVNIVNAGHMFVQQRTHPTFHALCGLDQHMSLCYSQPGVPTLPTPAEVGILCAAPVEPSVWWRAQVMGYFEETEEVEILYVDYGGYCRVKIEILRQIRSDFVSLPFQGVEVLLDNVIPLGDEDQFSEDADAAVKELTRGAPMLTQVTNYDEATRLPLVQLWRLNPEEMVSVNRTLVERGFAEWVDGF